MINSHKLYAVYNHLLLIDTGCRCIGHLTWFNILTRSPHRPLSPRRQRCLTQVLLHDMCLRRTSWHRMHTASGAGYALWRQTIDTPLNSNSYQSNRYLIFCSWYLCKYKGIYVLYHTCIIHVLHSHFIYYIYK